MEFSKKYRAGQQVYLVVQGEGVYSPTIERYEEEYNRYTTKSGIWYILPKSIVFEKEEELEEYKKTNSIYIDHGSSEWGYASRKSYVDFDY